MEDKGVKSTARVKMVLVCFPDTKRDLYFFQIHKKDKGPGEETKKKILNKASVRREMRMPSKWWV